MKKYLLFFLTLFWVNSLMAGVVTEKQALQKAQKFMKGKSFVVAGARSMSSDKTADEPSSFYVFNAENQGGFVIVSGDDRTPEILGYADSGELDMDKLPSNVKAWLDGYDRQIKALDKGAQPKMDMVSKSEIDALIRTKWNQGAPYNLQCPTRPDKNNVEQHCLTGCVATAIAQIMYYWKAPKTVTPSLKSYNVEEWNQANNTWEVLFSVPALEPTTFKWDLMRTTYNYSDTDDGAQAVAELMRYVGQSEEMSYGLDGSGASSSLGNWLSNFGYNKGAATWVNRDSYSSAAAWEEVIYTELSEKRPVLYSGSTKNSGHAFICDGYDGNGRFHINWGWGGSCDGHYLLNVLNNDPSGVGPDEAGTDLSQGWNAYQGAYIGIQPAQGNESVYFTSVSPENVSVQYVITSDKEGNRTCQVNGNGEAAIPMDYEGTLTIPSTVTYSDKTYQVTSIGANAFRKCSFNAINLPSTLTEIKSGAFAYNSNLAAFELPANVVTLGNSLFEGCSKLETLSVASGNAKYSSPNNCNAIIETSKNTLSSGCKNTVIPENVTAIAAYAFSGVSDMNLTIPKDVTEIGNYAFAYLWSSVITVKWAEPLAIPENVFEGAGGNNVILKVPADTKGDYLAATGWKAFKAENVYQGDEGTEFTTKVDEINMKFTITGSNTVKVGPMLGDWDDRAVDRNEAYGKTIIIPEIVKNGDKSYTVTAIGTYAFNNCYGMNLTLPATVASIGNQAFAWCSDGVLTVPFETPLIISENVFNGASQNNFKLKVPAGKKSAYKEAKGWSAFGDNILEGDEGTEFTATVSGLEMTFTVTSNNTVSVGCLNGSWEKPAVDRTAADNKQVVIPETVKDANGKEYTVTALGNNCFEGVNFASLTLPSTLESIGRWVLSYNGNLKELVIPASVTSIAPQAIVNCSNLSSLSVANGNETYDSRDGICAIVETKTNKIVVGTNKVTTIPSSVTAIGNSAFSNCRNLNLTIPESVTAIENYAFAWSSDGVITVLRTAPLTIPENTFENCGSNNVSLCVPAGAKSAYQTATGWSAFGDNILEGDEGTEFTTQVDGINMKFTITGGNTVKVGSLSGAKDDRAVNRDEVYGKTITIPETVKNGNKSYTVTAIGAYAFYNCNGMNLTLPATVASIGNQAFAWCYDGVLTVPFETPLIISENVFNGASQSNFKLKVPASKKAAYKEAKGWSAFGDNILEGNEGTEFASTVCGLEMTFTVTSSNTVSVGHFSGSNENTAVNKELANGKDVEIPETVKDANGKEYSVTALGDFSFYEVGIASLKLPLTLERIGAWSIAYNHNLSELVIPAGVNFIDQGAINGCSNLSLLSVADENKTYDSREGINAIVETKTNILVGGANTLTVIPSSVTSIGELALSYSSNMNLTIPESVTSIGNRAFMWCHSNVITIPKSVTAIGNYAFHGCSNCVITVPWLNPLEVPEDIFEDWESSNVILRVPAGSKDAYKKAKGWSAFGDNILEGDEGTEFTATVSGLEMTFTVTSGNTVKVGCLNGSWDKPAVDRTAADNKQVVIPETVKDANGKEYTVTALGDNCFQDVNFASLTLPSTLESIGRWVLSYNNIKELVIPASVTSIAPQAIVNCSNLSSLLVADGNNTYDSRDGICAIVETKTNKIVVGTNKVTTIPSSVTAIGEYAFSSCHKLNLTIPESVKSIDNYAFAWCSNGIITVPWSEPLVIQENTFLDCGLNNFSLRVPAGSKEAYKKATGWNVLGDNILEGDEGTEFTTQVNGINMKFTITGNSTVKVGSLTGAGDDRAVNRDEVSGKTIAIPETVTNGDKSYNVTAIGVNAFNNCSGMNLTLPAAVTSIGEDAFSNCHSINLTIPSAVNTIGDHAFAGCSSGIITVERDEPLDIPEHVFKYASGNGMKLRVPAGAKSKYAGAQGWSAFGDNILEGDEGVEFTATVSGLEMTFTVTGDNTAKVGFLSPQWESQAVMREDALGKNIIIPSEITNPKTNNKYKITALGDYCFRGIQMKSLTLPSTLESIGRWAIVDNYNITELVIPASVTSIAPQAIINCSNLSSLSVANGNETYDSRDGICAIVETQTNKIVVGTNKVTTIPSSVTAIGNSAFSNCRNLNLTIPKTVTNIGNYAFAWCSNSVITVPWAEPLTIPENTFEECGLNYVSLRVPAGSKETYKKATGWSAFGDNILEGDEGTEFTATVSGLEMTFTVTGDNTVKVGHLNGSWENRAVNRTVASGKDIEIPATIEYKGVPYAVTEIGAWAFHNCYNINITIPASVVSIGEQAFSHCYNNSVITVKYTDLSVVSVKENTFDGASENNTILKVPEGTKSLYENATGWNKFSSQNIKEIVKGTSKVVTIETAGTLATKISAEEKFRISELTITGPINGTDVRLIREMAGNDYQGRLSDGILEKLDLSGATIVAGGNKYLETNEIVASSGNSYWLNSEVDYVTRDNEIGEFFFTACEKLKELKLPAKVTSIGHGAFAMMRSLRAIELPASLTSINRGNLFSQCGNLTTLTITAGGIYSSPEGSNAIMKGTGLVLGIATTVIPDNTTAIGENAFDNGGITGKVILPASVKHIGHEAFANCNGLTEVVLPDGLLSIGNMAFVWSGIQKLNVPASVNSIGTQIVAGCHSLETLTVDGQNEKFDSRNNCNAIILSAENKLLHGCKTTVIPTTITSIGEYAIKHLYSDVEDVQLVIPSGVISIGEGAFMYSFYKSVKSLIAKPFKIDANVFDGIGSEAVLHVPSGSKALYEATEGWSTAFSQIVEMSEEIVANDVTYEMTEDNTIEVKTAEVNKTTGSVSIAQKVVVNNVAVPVTAIAPKAFQNVEAVKSVTIPATVESIGELAFAGCKNLKEVLCLNPDPVNLSVAAARGLLKDGNSGSTVSQFDGVNLDNCTLYVLTAAENDYRNAQGWNSFGTIKPFAGMGDVNTDKAIDVSDVVCEVNQILGKASDGFLYGAGDMNADNSIDVSDVVSIVNVILGKTAGARSMERQSALAETTASDHLSLMAGNEGGLSLVLDNTADYVAAQFDVRLSEGQTLEQVVKGQRARGHQLATAKIADDTYRVLLYTIGDRTFSGQSGEVVNLGVAGEGDVTVENITFITAGESRKKFDNLSNQLTGIGATLNDNGEMINDKAVWHDLQGRKLETAPTTKGVYLKNGKKVVVK